MTNKIKYSNSDYGLLHETVTAIKECLEAVPNSEVLEWQDRIGFVSMCRFALEHVALSDEGKTNMPCFARLVARMLEMMEFDHAHEIATNHEGDGPDGCTYCQWMEEARAAIASVTPTS